MNRHSNNVASKKSTWKWFLARAKSWVRYACQPHVNRSQFLDHWNELGIRPGCCLLVHSSLSALGYCVGGADTVLDSLLEQLGPLGTLVLPTHTWRTFNRGQRHFDVLNTPSQVGHISEVFRKRKGAIRSLHPTHSVAALGAAQDDLVKDHLLSTGPCGKGSPYDRLMDMDGQVLMLGVGLKNNTCFHTVEALAEVPYLLRDEDDRFSIVGYDGVTFEADVRCHAKAVASRFTETESPLTQHGCLRSAKIGQGSSMVLDAGTFRKLMLPALRARTDLLLASCDTKIELGS